MKGIGPYLRRNSIVALVAIALVFLLSPEFTLALIWQVPLGVAIVLGLQTIVDWALDRLPGGTHLDERKDPTIRERLYRDYIRPALLFALGLIAGRFFDAFVWK